MNSQDLVKLSADNEEHKQHKKRTKKIKAQLKDQVIYLYLVDYKTMNLNLWSQAMQEKGYFPTLFKQQFGFFYVPFNLTNEEGSGDVFHSLTSLPNNAIT